MRRHAWTLPLLLLSACPPASDSVDAGPGFVEGSFPAGFFWGTATAGFQVESGCPTLSASECEDPNSDWYQFVMRPEFRTNPNAHLKGDDVSRGPGFRELYAQDLQRAREELGNNAVRFGLEWSRIFPTSTRGVEGHEALLQIANSNALAYYHDVLSEARSRGLRPLVTLNHYTLPLWMHDALACNQNINTCTNRGWLDESIITELAKFSGFAAREFGAEVDWWATQNEPMAVVLAGYVFPSETRTNPPAVSFQLTHAKTVMANMQVAHARQYDAVKANDTVDADGDGTSSMVGLVYNLAPVLPKDPAKPGDVVAADDADYLYNRAFLNGTIKGEFDPDLDGTPELREDMAGRMDYLGINYYTRIIVEGTSDGQPVFPELSSRTTFNPLTLDQGPIYARGIYDVTVWARDYGLPIMITENGAISDGSADTAKFIVEHLRWLSRAIRDGADVRGYFWWTLMDNYEWNHGMDIRMGMYSVDPDDPTKARTARPVVQTYRTITDANAIPHDLLARYPE